MAWHDFKGLYLLSACCRRSGDVGLLRALLLAFSLDALASCKYWFARFQETDVSLVSTCSSPLFANLEAICYKLPEASPRWRALHAAKHFLHRDVLLGVRYFTIIEL